MKIGIIGNAADKFTPELKELAERVIKDILADFKPGDVLVSGRCPLGGVDVWAEEMAKAMGIPTDIKVPKQHRWDAEYGFKQRNIDIAKESVHLWVIVVEEYPEGYVGRRFKGCYHCGTSDHVKSGACWTAKQADKVYGNFVFQVILRSKNI